MRVSVGDCRLFVDIEGLGLVPDGPTMRQRPTLLALHGGPGFDHTSFKPRFGALADVAQVVYLDHRGQGRSDRSTPQHWTLDRWADDLVALCEALEIVEPIVYGVSFGSMVAAHYAARHPGHAGGVVLDSTAAFANLPAVLDMFERLGGAEARDAADAFWKQSDPETGARYFEVCMPLYNRHPTPDGGDVSARTFEHANMSLFAHWQAGEHRTFDLRPSLSEITSPVLVLAGEDDPITPLAGAREIADLLGPDRCTLRTFADCGHGVWRDQPDAAFAAIRSFIAAHG